jgi:hypothetical protein
MTKLFQPTQKQISDSNLRSFEVFVKKSHQKTFKDYFQLWSWSVKNPDQFWQSITEFFEAPIHLKKNVKDNAKRFKFLEHLFLSQVQCKLLSVLLKKIILKILLFTLLEKITMKKKYPIVNLT